VEEPSLLRHSKIQIFQSVFDTSVCVDTHGETEKNAPIFDSHIMEKPKKILRHTRQVDYSIGTLFG
jgi:hypothetical protein